MSALPIGNWAIRIAGLVALVLGAVTWVNADAALAVRPVHMLAGLTVMAGLLVLASLGFRAGVPTLPLVAVAWAILLPVFGLTQESITLLPRAIIQTSHLVVGVISIGLGEMLSMRISRPKTALAKAN